MNRNSFIVIDGEELNEECEQEPLKCYKSELKEVKSLYFDEIFSNFNNIDIITFSYNFDFLDTLNDEPVKGYTGNLSVNGIEIGTRVADAIDDLKQQNAWVDSEYDPYHDGCTDIFVAYLSDEDTEFTLPDMLDCYIEFSYVKANDDEWSLMEKRETNETINKENAASTKGEPLLKVQYSIFVPEDGDIVKDGVIAGVLVSIDNHTHIV